MKEWKSSAGKGDHNEQRWVLCYGGGGGGEAGGGGSSGGNSGGKYSWPIELMLGNICFQMIASGIH